MLLRIHPETPEKRLVDRIAADLQNGKIYILPTDTVYAFVASLDAPRAINEIYRLKQLPENRPLSLLCRDVAMASLYALQIPNPVFRFMKSHTPGPYTFVLKSNRTVDRRGVGKKKEVGVRIVDHPLHRALMERLDIPLIASSLTIDDDDGLTDPDDLDQLYGSQVEGVVDGGIRAKEYSTIIDCRQDPLHLLRRGVGDVAELEDLLVEDER